MRKTPLFIILFICLLFSMPEYLPAASVTVDSVISGLEGRYEKTGFTARFIQTSTLKAMEITDTAEGGIYIKPPGGMRWEYETPDRQTVISDGESLWIHRIDDNQVMVGKAPTFFGRGKGAGFLSDIGQIRQSFTLILDVPNDANQHVLKMVPKKETPDLSEIDLTIDAETFEIIEITTVNVYEDETRITLSDRKFGIDLTDEMFTFRIPEGADVVQIDE